MKIKLSDCFVCSDSLKNALIQCPGVNFTKNVRQDYYRKRKVLLVNVN